PGGRFVPSSVWHRHVTAVRDGMRSLNCLPRGMLALAEHLFFARMPADCSRIEENLSATESGQTSGFRVPLVPANQHADRRKSSLPGPESQVPGSEIEFLIKERVIRNMHLSILTKAAAVRIDDRSRVMVTPRRPPLEYRRDDD